MSLQTWIEEFYPTTASTPMSRIEAIKHSILKWHGLRRENLEKHGVARFHWDMPGERPEVTRYLVAREDMQGPPRGSGHWFDTPPVQHFEIASDTCALCANYAKGVIVQTEDGRVDTSCQDCPLAFDKDEGDTDNACADEYGAWTDSNNPEPMIESLESALQRELEHA